MALLDEREQSPAAWRSYLNGHEAHLRELRSFTPEVYLAVSLPGAARRPGSIGCAGASRACSASRIRCRSRRRRSTPWSSPRNAPSAAPRRRLPVRRATTRELQWLLRRAACRGVAEPALDDHWEPSALIVETAQRAAGLRAAGHGHRAPRQRAGARAGPRAGRRRRGGPLASGDARDGRAAGGVGVPGRRRVAVLAAGGAGVPGRRGRCTRAGSATARRSRACAGGSSTPTSPSASSCSRRTGRCRTAAEENRQLARELDAYLQSHERPPLLNVAISLAVGAPSAGELEARVEALVHRFGTVALHRPLGLQPALFLDHLPARRRRHGPRLRRRADDRAVRRADAGRHPPGRLRARRLHRPHARRRRAAGALRRHRGLADGPAAVDPARRHARVGQDDRGRAARVPGRAPRLAGRRRRPQARPQPRGPARARRPRARDRALRRRSLPRPARPARRRARSRCARTSPART